MTFGKHINVGNVEEAVELAWKFKQEGKYDWFRGQQKDWTPSASVYRLKKSDLKRENQRMSEFLWWMNNTKGLEYLHGNEDAQLAIAQHYGLSTTFLDFTTDPSVAGYFASQVKKYSRNTHGYIYCLNTIDLSKWWQLVKSSKPDLPTVDFISEKVSNLWRLEAQHGVFLYCPKGWENVYAMEVIVFPQTGPPSFPTKEQIYPTKKSQLELLLDHYFFVDRLERFHEMREKLFPDAIIIRDEGAPDRVEPKFFTKGKLPRQKDWKLPNLNQWLKVSAESFRSTTLGEIELRINMKNDAHEIRSRVLYGVQRALQMNPDLRNQSIRWKLLPDRPLPKQLSHAIDWLWNGLRLLPYSSDSIAEGIATCFALYKFGYSRATDSNEQQEIVLKCIPHSMRLEIGSKEGGVVRCFASSTLLRNAVRADLLRHLKAEYRPYANDISAILSWCSNPSKLFVFEQLANLFATQLVPTQVLKSGAEVAIFSPARLEGFGLP